MKGAHVLKKSELHCLLFILSNRRERFATMPTRILIVGAGAIGAFFGSRLARVSNVLVSALCRSNYKAVKASGFKLTSPKFGDYTFRPEHTFASPDEAKQSQLKWDYLLVATKALPDVNDGSMLLDGLVSSDSSIVLAQNGLGIEEPYRLRFPGATVLSAVTNASCSQPEPGVIKHNRWTRISIGPYLPHLDFSSSLKPQDEVAVERNRTFVELLQAAGITDAEIYSATNLQFVRWHKVAINASMNPTAVLSGGAGNQQVSLDPHLAEHARGVMNEVLFAASHVLGKEIPWKELRLATPEQILESVKRNTTGSRPSMWHDWTKAQKMELEVILGNPIRLAKSVSVEMPRCQSMYALLRKAQERREIDSKL